MTRELATKIAVVFVLFILGAVTLNFLFGDLSLPGYQSRFVTFALSLALGILSIGATVAAIVYIFGYVFIHLKRHNRGQTRGFGSEQTEAFNARLNEMERRLTDVQDVLISMDDKLSRSEGHKTAG